MSPIYAAAVEPWGGHYIVDNTVRLFTIFIGFLLAGVSLKIAWRMGRRGNWERMCGAISFALIVIAPSVTRLVAFDEPIVWLSTSLYLAGLLIGCVAIWFRVTIAPPWLKRRPPGKRRVPTRRDPKGGK